jgi:hypothetical protein
VPFVAAAVCSGAIRIDGPDRRTGSFALGVPDDGGYAVEITDEHESPLDEHWASV